MRRNLLLGLTVTCLFFAALEAGLRLSGRVATNTLRSPDLETLDAIPGILEPAQEFVDRVRPDLPYRVRINALGFRGEEFARDRPPGRARVICLGDSYTFGHYVNDEEAWPAVLAAGLRAAGHEVEVINAGVNGFTIADERRYLEERLMSLRPDVVVVVFSQNDLADLVRPRPMIESMRDHAAVKSMPIVGPIVKVLQHTAIFNALQRLAARARGARRGEAAARAERDPEALWARYEDHLRAVAALVQRGGAGGIVVAWPSERQIAGEEPADANARLAEAAARAGLAFLDLTPSLRALAASGAAVTFAPRDGHPSPQAHAAAAWAIGEALALRGWIPAPGEAS